MHGASETPPAHPSPGCFKKSLYISCKFRKCDAKCVAFSAEKQWRNRKLVLRTVPLARPTKKNWITQDYQRVLRTALERRVDQKEDRTRQHHHAIALSNMWRPPTSVSPHSNPYCRECHNCQKATTAPSSPSPSSTSFLLLQCVELHLCQKLNLRNLHCSHCENPDAVDELQLRHHQGPKAGRTGCEGYRISTSGPPLVPRPGSSSDPRIWEHPLLLHLRQEALITKGHGHNHQLFHLLCGRENSTKWRSVRAGDLGHRDLLLRVVRESLLYHSLLDSVLHPAQRGRRHRYIENLHHGNKLHDVLHCVPLSPFLRPWRLWQAGRPRTLHGVFLVVQLEERRVPGHTGPRLTVRGHPGPCRLLSPVGRRASRAFPPL